jgi:hypothetical protein
MRCRKDMGSRGCRRSVGVQAAGVRRGWSGGPLFPNQRKLGDVAPVQERRAAPRR